ncbi:MAG: hypothetical protein SF182_15460 [Deltaproteobacteria bacterium]|nr:hypothetical protein [Deltaproteobacteria bacterium]
MMRTLSQPRAARRALAALALAALTLGVAERASAQCAGDCNGDNTVAINELITGVNIALGSAPVSACPSFDGNGNGEVAINEIIAAVNNALGSCPTGSDTPTPTATRTPTTPSGPTATATPTTPIGGSCGNGDIELSLGETCDDGGRAEGPGDACPANCRIAPCQPSGQQITVAVDFDTDPGDLLLLSLTLFVRYPDGTVDVPGASADPPVVESVTSDFFSITPNDQNYALTAVLLDPFLSGVGAGNAIRVTFNVCEGAAPPDAGDFTCQVVNASDLDNVEVGDQVTCRVSVP